MTRERIPMTEANREKNQPYDIDVIPEPVHPPKATKVINWTIAVALVVAAIGLGIFLRWSFASENILEVENSPFPARVVADPSLETGGVVFLKAKYCKNTDDIGIVRMSYVSKSREILLPLVKERLPKGCNDSEVPVVIPLNLVRDEYRIKFHVTYNVNPVKKNITSDFESQPVIVGTSQPE